MSAGAAEFSNSFERFLAETRNGSYAPRGETADVALGERVRIGRNLTGFPFTNRANAAQRSEIFQKILAAVPAVPALRDAFVFEAGELSEMQSGFLAEHHFVAPDFKKVGAGPAVVIARSRELALKINSVSGHVLVQSFASAGNGDAFAVARETERLLAEQLDFAFSEKYGFLAANPEITGTTLIAMELLHLPALAGSAQLEKIARALEAVGLLLRGSYGEESHATACVYQISSSYTLGVSETETADVVRRWAAKIRSCELDARKRLFARERVETLDRIARAYGILRNAVTLTHEESTDLLSLLRLGCDVGFFSENDRARFDELLTETARAHIFCRAEFRRKICDERRENLLRARLFRETLSTVRPPKPPDLR